MEKKSLLAVCAAMLALTACQEDIEKGSPATTGDEISFAAGHAEFEFNDPTRTVYGDRDGSQYPIYWENGDQIGIFCPEGSSPDNTSQHDYAVQVSDDHSSTGVLAKNSPGENGLQWGEGDVHNFYAIYPASASEGGLDATSVRCSLPQTQTPERIEYANGTYTAYPNMDYAYMYAHSQVSRLTQGDQPITLNFQPLVTVLEITVNGPTSTPTQGDYQVSNIEIRSDRDLIGDFKLTVDPDMGADDGLCEPIDNGTVDNVVSIPTYYNGEPVTLRQGEKLVVKAFLLPYAHPEIRTTTVTVRYQNGSKTKLLTTADIQSRKINVTSLPALPSVNEQETYYWMSSLDPRTYITQLSIPGSHNSYSIDENLQQGSNTLMEAYQNHSIADQFAAGARAFSFMVGFANDQADDAVDYSDHNIASDFSNWNNDYEMYVFDGNTQTGNTLGNVINTFSNLLSQAIAAYPVEGRDCNEFIVLNIDFRQQRSSGDNNEGKYTEVRRWIREVDRILNENKTTNGIELVTNGITPTTTIADVRGKIIVFVNYQAPTLPVNEGSTRGGLLGEEFAGYTYTPLATNPYIFLRNVYDANNTLLNSTFWAQNDRDIDKPYYLIPEGNSTGMQIWKQTLQRLETPGLSTTPSYAGRIDTKVQITKDFFNTAVANNQQDGTAGLDHWYFNDLGGFCVVNDNQSYSPELGASGNTVRAAHEVNSRIYDFLVDPTTGFGPMGVVLINFYGTAMMNDVSSQNLDLYGQWLPTAVLETNFRFQLKRADGGSTQDLPYDATFSNGGSVIR